MHAGSVCHGTHSPTGQCEPMRTFEAATTVTFQPGLSKLHGKLRNCVAAGVYNRGLSNVAAQVGETPASLSEKLNGGTGRKRDVGCDLLEEYIAKSGDLTPIYYLIDRFLTDPSVSQQHILAALFHLCEDLPGLLKAAGMTKPRGK